MVPEPRSAYALQFFLLAASLLAIAAGLAYVLLGFFPVERSLQRHPFSPAFLVSTALLFAGSWCMHRNVGFVRRERQKEFRQSLKLTLLTGLLFVAVQTYALACLIRQQPGEDASEGAPAFTAVFATLHGMHFVIAFLFLCFITVQSFADRYDHEYYWGVVFCAWFWHALGIAWVAILGVMMIAQVCVDSA